MIVSAQVAIYPLRQDRLTPAITAVSVALLAAGLRPEVSPMSTMVTGEVVGCGTGQIAAALHHIYSSPLGRAVETARLLAEMLGELPVEPDARLAEYDFGAWDGLTPTELRARGFWEAVQHDPEFTPPQGEPFGAAARRVVAALHGVAARHPGARVAVVGHGLTLAAALALLLDGNPRRAPQYALDNAGMAELVLNSRPRLVHLDPVVS
jgi:broad specificity phosphatase PhoE